MKKLMLFVIVLLAANGYAFELNLHFSRVKITETTIHYDLEDGVVSKADCTQKIKEGMKENVVIVCGKASNILRIKNQKLDKWDGVSGTYSVWGLRIPVVCSLKSDDEIGFKEISCDSE